MEGVWTAGHSSTVVTWSAELPLLAGPKEVATILKEAFSVCSLDRGLPAEVRSGVEGQLVVMRTGIMGY